MENRKTFYRNGELVAYTGNSEVKYGCTWYELEVIGDSHRIGATLVTGRAPTHTDKLEGAR